MRGSANSVAIPVENCVALKMMKSSVSRSWILFDKKGQSAILDLDKQGIMKRVPIHTRDLRILDPLLSYPSTILGREKVIVLNLEVVNSINSHPFSLFVLKFASEL